MAGVVLLRRLLVLLVRQFLLLFLVPLRLLRVPLASLLLALYQRMEGAAQVLEIITVILGVVLSTDIAGMVLLIVVLGVFQDVMVRLFVVAVEGVQCLRRWHRLHLRVLQPRPHRLQHHRAYRLEQYLQTDNAALRIRIKYALEHSVALSMVGAERRLLSAVSW